MDRLRECQNKAPHIYDPHERRLTEDVGLDQGRRQIAGGLGRPVSKNDGNRQRLRRDSPNPLNVMAAQSKPLERCHPPSTSVAPAGSLPSGQPHAQLIEEKHQSVGLHGQLIIG